MGRFLMCLKCKEISQAPATPCDRVGSKQNGLRVREPRIHSFSVHGGRPPGRNQVTENRNRPPSGARSRFGTGTAMHRRSLVRGEAVLEPTLRVIGLNYRTAMTVAVQRLFHLETPDEAAAGTSHPSCRRHFTRVESRGCLRRRRALGGSSSYLLPCPHPASPRRLRSVWQR